MSMQTLIDELARLERDVQALSNDVPRPPGDAVGRAVALRDEIIAAEYVATEETLENVSSVLEALLRLREVHESYWRVFFTDHEQTLNALKQSRSPADVLQAGLEHWGRCTTHAVDGFRQTFNVLASTGRSLSNTFVEMWGPFAELVRRDRGVHR